MTHVCSVILVRRSFDIYHEQQKISLYNESILLLDKNLADDFAFCSPDTRRLDIDELTVCHYLQNIRQIPRNLGLHSKDRLLINQSPPMPLVTAIFDSFNDSGVNSPILSKMLYLSCLSMFSHKKELIPLLFNSISTVSGKVERLISFDIAKRWYLRDIAERMYTSESLIKKSCRMKIPVSVKYYSPPGCRWPDDYSSYVKFLCILLRKNVAIAVRRTL